MATQVNVPNNEQNPYRKCLVNAHKVNWDIDRDVIRFRELDTDHKYLPDSLSRVDRLPFMTTAQQRFFSQVQGRSYAGIFGLVERFINAKVLEMGQAHAMGDQHAVEALVNFSAEELKHQELFRRVERLAADRMPPGYALVADPDEVAAAVLSKSTWSVLGLTCHIEIFTQVHYLESIRDNADLSPLFADVFRCHWLEEAQHATLDEMEWQRVHDGMSAQGVDEAVDDLIELVAAVDGILQAQAAADTTYFLAHCGDEMTDAQRKQVGATMLSAYRWQYIVSGVQVPRFQAALASKISDAQMDRVMQALTPLVENAA